MPRQNKRNIRMIRTFSALWCRSTHMSNIDIANTIAAYRAHHLVHLDKSTLLASMNVLAAVLTST